MRVGGRRSAIVLGVVGEREVEQLTDPRGLSKVLFPSVKGYFEFVTKRYNTRFHPVSNDQRPSTKPWRQQAACVLQTLVSNKQCS
jgi:hypothetical protein